MSAIITDQLRILNSENFVAGIASTTNSYYAWIGLPNPADFQSDWSENPPAPKDSFSEENDYWDTMIALKKLNSDDIARLVRKITSVKRYTITLVNKHIIYAFNIKSPISKYK